MVDALNAPLAHEVTFAAVVPTCVHTELLRRWILNPLSLPDMSVHARFIWLVDTAVAVRLAGAEGIGVGVGVGVGIGVGVGVGVGVGLATEVVAQAVLLAGETRPPFPTAMT